MHEEALLRDLRRKIDELSVAHPGCPVVRARVVLGPLAHLDEPRLRELWARGMAGGPAAGAQLEVDLLETLDDAGSASIVLRSVTFTEPERPSPAPGRRPRGPASSSARET